MLENQLSRLTSASTTNKDCQEIESWSSAHKTRSDLFIINCHSKHKSIYLMQTCIILPAKIHLFGQIELVLKHRAILFCFENLTQVLPNWRYYQGMKYRHVLKCVVCANEYNLNKWPGIFSRRRSRLHLRWHHRPHQEREWSPAG
jgi:hypothetical protein